MPELKSTYIGELKIAVTGTCMLGDGPLGRRHAGAADDNARRPR